MPASPERATLFRRLLPVAGIVTLCSTLALLFVFAAPSLWDRVRDVERLRADILATGNFAARGIFVLLQVAQVIVFIIPGEAVQVAGGYLFGAVEGSLLSLLGITAGSLVAFGLARLLGRSFASAVLGSNRLTRLEQLIHSPAGRSIIYLLFFIPGIPKDALCYAAGLTPVRFRVFFTATLVGRIPGIVLSALFGSGLSGRNLPLVIGVVVIVAAVLVAAPFLRRRWLGQKSPNPRLPV